MKEKISFRVGLWKKCHGLQQFREQHPARKSEPIIPRLGLRPNSLSATMFLLCDEFPSLNRHLWLPISDWYKCFLVLIKLLLSIKNGIQQKFCYQLNCIEITNSWLIKCELLYKNYMAAVMPFRLLSTSRRYALSSKPNPMQIGQVEHQIRGGL